MLAGVSTSKLRQLLNTDNILRSMISANRDTVLVKDESPELMWDVTKGMESALAIQEVVQQTCPVQCSTRSNFSAYFACLL